MAQAGAGNLGGDAQRGFDGASISIAHVTLVFITGARINLNMMFAGVNDNSWRGVGLFVPAMLLVAVLHE
jgi:hypothetical protein